MPKLRITIGIRRAVKDGLVSAKDILAAGVDLNPRITAWLRRRKEAGK